MGRLTRDPEIRYSQANNIPIATYTLAVDRPNRNGSDGPTADFLRCISFQKSAEFAEQYLRKGIKIAVTGRIQTGSYTNRDGQKVISITKKEFISVFENTLLCADLDITGLSLIDADHVVITFKGGGKRKVNIEADSKGAIILDVMHHAF